MCVAAAELRVLRTDLVTVVAVAPPSAAGAVLAIAARLERASGGADTVIGYGIGPPKDQPEATVVQVVCAPEVATEASAQFIKAGATLG